MCVCGGSQVCVFVGGVATRAGDSVSVSIEAQADWVSAIVCLLIDSICVELDYTTVVSTYIFDLFLPLTNS